MQIGVIFPQLEIGSDPAILNEYARTAVAAGYRYLLAYDHVLGADVTHRPGWTRYTAADQFHEPFVLYGYLAGIAPELALTTGVIILPQRQTALVAKQAAEVDILTGGKFRLGVGLGWNEVEYQALNEPFRNRARRLEEQIAVLRELWTKPVVTFHGKAHQIEAAGLNPLPIQRPIPIWMGGRAPKALDRIGRLADGWISQSRPQEQLRVDWQRVRAAAAAAGRNPEAIGLEGRLSVADVPETEWRDEVRRWRELGAAYLGINTMNAGLATPQAHIDLIKHFMETVA